MKYFLTTIIVLVFCCSVAWAQNAKPEALISSGFSLAEIEKELAEHIKNLKAVRGKIKELQESEKRLEGAALALQALTEKLKAKKPKQKKAPVAKKEEQTKKKKGTAPKKK